MEKKPIILVTSEQDYGAAMMRFAPYYNINKPYTHSITAVGGIPITPLATCMDDQYCDMADGLLLTGGKYDIHPGRYNTPFLDEMSGNVHIYRDALEFEMFKAFYKAGKPIMGICRGNLLINVALGGTLIQSLKKVKGLEHSDGSSHTITAEPGSILEKLYGKEFSANTFHRQAVEKLGTGLKITAHSADGVPEALEHENKKIFSVQFHPELMLGENAKNFKGPDMLSLFDYFVNLCR